MVTINLALLFVGYSFALLAGFRIVSLWLATRAHSIGILALLHASLFVKLLSSAIVLLVASFGDPSGSTLRLLAGMEWGSLGFLAYAIVVWASRESRAPRRAAIKRGAAAAILGLFLVQLAVPKIPVLSAAFVLALLTAVAYGRERPSEGEELFHRLAAKIGPVLALLCAAQAVLPFLIGYEWSLRLLVVFPLNYAFLSVIWMRSQAGREGRQLVEGRASLSDTRRRLSEREYEVASLLVLGRSNKEIAADLFISLNTVKRHIYSLFKKLEVESRYDLIAKYAPAAQESAARQGGP